MKDSAKKLSVSPGEGFLPEDQHRKEISERIGQLQNRITMKLAALLEHPDVPQSFKNCFESCRRKGE